MNSPQSVVAHSKSVHGVCFDPFHDETLATFSEEGVIKLWDIRNFVEPVILCKFTKLTLFSFRNLYSIHKAKDYFKLNGVQRDLAFWLQSQKKKELLNFGISKIQSLWVS